MPNVNGLPIEFGKVTDVTIGRHQPNYDDLSWQTLTTLTGGCFTNPGEEDQIAHLFRSCFGKRGIFRPGTIYVNPRGIVRAPGPTKRFFQLARQLQGEWFQGFSTEC